MLAVWRLWHVWAWVQPARPGLRAVQGGLAVPTLVARTFWAGDRSVRIIRAFVTKLDAAVSMVRARVMRRRHDGSVNGKKEQPAWGRPRMKLVIAQVLLRTVSTRVGAQRYGAANTDHFIRSSQAGTEYLISGATTFPVVTISSQSAAWSTKLSTHRPEVQDRRLLSLVLREPRPRLRAPHPETSREVKHAPARV